MPIQKRTNRIEKINSLIQRELGMILLPYLKGQPAIVTISKVEASRDLRWAKVWISIVGGKDGAIMEMLNHNLYDIQGELNRVMAVKIIPRISFHLDTTARYAEHISKIFQEIEKEKEHDDGSENAE